MLAPVNGFFQIFERTFLNKNFVYKHELCTIDFNKNTKVLQ